MELIKEGAKENKPGVICSQEMVARGLVESSNAPEGPSPPPRPPRLSEQMGCAVGETTWPGEEVTLPELTFLPMSNTDNKPLFHRALGKWVHRGHIVDTSFLLSFLFSKFP